MLVNAKLLNSISLPLFFLPWKKNIPKKKITKNQFFSVIIWLPINK